MEREKQQRDALDPDESSGISATEVQEENLVVNLIDEMVPASDEAVSETLEEHQTEGQGE